jgi:ribonuclease VapC
VVIDTSAVIAVLAQEPEAERLVRAMDAAESLQISAASVLEAGIVVLSRYGEAGKRALDHWLTTSPIEIMVVTREQVAAARDGFQRFGKGRHPASLNFGDCFSYALARTLGETLLFGGNDFAKTDARAALTAKE